MKKRLKLFVLSLLLILLFSLQASAAEKVHKYYYKGRIKKDCTVTSTSKTKTSKIKLAKKTEVIVDKKGSKGKKYYLIKLSVEDNINYVIPRSYVKIFGIYTQGKDYYSQKVAENFVNKKGYYSGTRYLIWVSSYTQHMYIFKGRRKNWKLYKHWACSTGRYEWESKFGRSTIRSRQMNWYWEDTIAYYATHIKGGAIHSWTYKQVSGRRTSGKLGKPRTHGCVRVDIVNAKWIYYSIPNGTGVYLY